MRVTRSWTRPGGGRCSDAPGYGGATLLRAAGDFEARFTYLIRQLGAEAEDIGVHMRGSAFAYEERDAMTAASFDELGGMLH